MKKLYALIIVIAILFAFSGCSKKTTADIVVSSDESSDITDNVVSNAMPDVESTAGGDVVIDINELLNDSSSTVANSSDSQATTSSEILTAASSKTGNSSTSATSSSTSSTASTVGASQIVGGTDSGAGYTSGWIN